MHLPKGLQQMRNIPMFPLIPLVPIGVMASVILLGILNLRALKRLEKEWHSIGRAGLREALDDPADAQARVRRSSNP